MDTKYKYVKCFTHWWNSQKLFLQAPGKLSSDSDTFSTLFKQHTKNFKGCGKIELKDKFTLV